MTNDQSKKLTLPDCEICGSKEGMFVIRRDVLHVTKHTWGTEERYDWFSCSQCRIKHQIKTLQSQLKQLEQDYDWEL